MKIINRPTVNNQRQSKVSRGAFLRTLALGAPFLASTALEAQTNQAAATPEPTLDLGNLRTFVELARADIRTQKAVILAENIDFTADEAVEFWPVQREYELELNRLLDRRYELILRYARQYESMTDKDATQLAKDVFDLEAKRTALKRKYFRKFSRVVPALKAARFFQIENQLNMVVDLQVAASLPLIK